MQALFGLPQLRSLLVLDSTAAGEVRTPDECPAVFSQKHAKAITGVSLFF
jgi:hypothetical protein